MPLHLALLAAAFVPTLANSPVAGDSESLRLAFDGPRVTGAFREEAGTGPVFSCSFLLTGTWRAGGRDVLTWWPGDASPDTRIRGRRTVDKPQTTAALKLASEPGGCGMAGEDFVRGAGYEGLRGGKQPWIAVREVRSPRGRRPPPARGRAGGGGCRARAPVSGEGDRFASIPAPRRRAHGVRVPSHGEGARPAT